MYKASQSILALLAATSLSIFFFLMLMPEIFYSRKFLFLKYLKMLRLQLKFRVMIKLQPPVVLQVASLLKDNLANLVNSLTHSRRMSNLF